MEQVRRLYFFKGNTRADSTLEKKSKCTMIFKSFFYSFCHNRNQLNYITEELVDPYRLVLMLSRSDLA